jgi:hypothetical protein
MLVENKEKTELFNQYRAMIEDAAWKTARKFAVEVEETRSTAYIVFCEAIDRFDANKNTLFGSYLYYRLKTVKDIYSKPHRKRKLIQNYSVVRQNCAEFADITLEIFKTEMETMETALCLSEDAQGVLNFLISREWETPGTAKTPRLHSVQKWLKYQFDWMPSRTKKAWDELKVWWQSEGQSTFSMGGSI